MSGPNHLWHVALRGLPRTKCGPRDEKTFSSLLHPKRETVHGGKMDSRDLTAISDPPIFSQRKTDILVTGNTLVYFCVSSSTNLRLERYLQILKP